MTFQNIDGGMNEQPLKVSTYHRVNPLFPNSEKTLGWRERIYA